MVNLNIPKGVYYNSDLGEFYCTKTNKKMDEEFHYNWFKFRDFFNKSAKADLRRDYDLTNKDDQISSLNDPLDINLRMVGSCTCMTKTPELKYHADSCYFKKLGVRLEEVEANLNY